MSIAIIAMTDDFVIVATDSKNSHGDGTYPQIPKMFRCNDNLVAYGVGKVGLYRGFFIYLSEAIKHKGQITAEDAEAVMKKYSEIIFANKGFGNNSGYIGICGACDDKPYAAWREIGAAEDSTHTLTPGMNLSVKIFAPTKAGEKECLKFFKQREAKISSKNNQLTQQQIHLYACNKTIAYASTKFNSIDNTMQYWWCNLKSNEFDYKILSPGILDIR